MELGAQMGRLGKILAATLALLLPLQALGISGAALNAALNGAELYSSVNSCSATTTTGTGTLPASVPTPYNSVFTSAANAYNVPPAFLAALFYAGEHGGTLPVTASQWPNAAGPWADSGVTSPGQPDWPGGAHHGAAGPFQFEYPTWQKYAVDGNNDGQKDVENLVDAAYSAANYLASLGANTTDETKLHQAAYSYNGSGPQATAYADKVIAAYEAFGGTGGGGNGATSLLENLLAPSAYAAAASQPPPNPNGGSDTLNGYTLPATKGGTGEEGATSGFAFGAPKSPDELKYFINMRWTYASWNWDGTSQVVDSSQFSFLNSNHPRLIVTDPTTGKSVIADALDAGPAPWTGTPYAANNPPSYWQTPQTGTPSQYTGRVSGLAPAAMQAIGASQRMADGSGDDLLYAWDSDQTDPLGPTTKSVSNYNPGNGCTAQAAGSVNGAAILQLVMDEYNKRPTEWDPTILGYTEGADEPWCADLVSWIFKQAGQPFGSGSNWRLSAAVDVEKWFQQNGTWVANQPGAPPPQPGDVYYINYAGGATGGSNDHVGFVVSVNGTDLKTLNGDWGGTIGYQDYPNYQSNAEIIGWGRLK